MRVPLTLSIAVSYLLSRRRQSVISIMGVATGVGFFIAVAAMMQGFQSYFVNKIVDIAPHIIMKDEFRTPPTQPVFSKWPDATINLRGLKPKEELRGIRNAKRIISEISTMPNLSIAPILQGQVFLRYGSRDIAASLVGIDPMLERGVSNIDKDIVEGSLNNLLTNSNGIILGAGVASKLGANLNSKITVVSPQGVILLMKVVGITRTGITAIDYSETYALLKKSQILQKRDNRINRIKMRVKDINQADIIAESLEGRYGWRTEGWQETNENVFSLFRVQNIIMYSVTTAILIVAGFGIFNIITTVVNEKTRDIAILKSMGFSALDVQKIFIIQGLFVGLIGTISGFLLSFVLMDILGRIPINMGEKGVIDITHMMINEKPIHFVVAGTLAIISAIISSVIPSRKAARLNPVEIIRSAA